MSYDLTIPVWGIIAFAVPFCGAGLWVLVKMFFWQKSADKRIEEIETIIALWDSKHQKLERETNEKFDKMLEKQIETQTMVRLLVDNKIKNQ